VVGSPTAQINAPANNQTYNLNQSVGTSFSCADPASVLGIQSCTDSNGAGSPSGRLDTSTVGPHTYTVSAISKDGQTATAQIGYTVVVPPTAPVGSPAGHQTHTVIGPPTATILAPRGGRVYRFDQRVLTRFGCREASGGPGLRS